MTRSHLSLVVSNDVSGADDAPGRSATSFPKVVGNVFDPQRMRADFPDMWADWLRLEFGKPEAVALVFGVTFQTACNWLGGISRPTGDKVALAMLLPGWRAVVEAKMQQAA